MIQSYPIDVTASGAVHLGDAIVCDGFHFEALARVQTHIHEDHMEDFDSSKGFQKIFMSDATRRLLINEKNADLPIRDNLIALDPGVPYDVDGCRLTLQPSGHMLGAVQTCVELPNGTRLGYSGDLGWPCPEVIQVDALVLDSTYGTPQARREFSQGEVESRLLELVYRLLKRGPIDLIAHRGTLQRALQVLTGRIDCPILGSPFVRSEVAIYRQCGYCIDEITLVGSEQGQAAFSDGRYVRVYGKGDRVPTDRGRSSRITLSAFMAQADDPVLEYSDVAYRVALSDHADFESTLEYVQATGAKFVVTDNTRGGSGVRLALEIQDRLGIPARPSSNRASREWGA